MTTNMYVLIKTVRMFIAFKADSSIGTTEKTASSGSSVVHRMDKSHGKTELPCSTETARHRTNPRNCQTEWQKRWKAKEGARQVSLYRRGQIWWYKFRFSGQMIRESSESESKTVAK